MRLRHVLTAALAVTSLTAITRPASADSVDDVITAEMAKRHIHGVSIAVVDGGKIVRASAYGTVAEGGVPVTPDTLFQAGSISKSVSALGALHYVEAGKLSLDDDVNPKLVGWHLPKSILTDIRPVTLRRLLSHTAGLTVHGFPGYAIDAPKPTMEQILDGAKPANTPAVRVDVLPGVMWRYSGGGFTIMQKLMVDVLGKPFPQLLDDAVLKPAGMVHSTFAQPLPADKARLTASGYYEPKRMVPGRWHIYPEMAAAGLWTTPSDLMRFGLELGKAWRGESKVITQAMARKMMSVERNDYGLGIGVLGGDKFRGVAHGGRDDGFDAQFLFFPETGQGVAIMIDANDNSRAVRRIVEAVERQYKFPEQPPALATPVAVDKAHFEAIAGSYELRENDVLLVAMHEGQLYRFADGMPDEPCVPIAPDKFRVGGIELMFPTVDGKVVELNWAGPDGQRHHSPRIAPPLLTLTVKPDPDAALTAKILAALKDLAKGTRDKTALAIFTPGLAKDIAGPYPALDEVQQLRHVDGWPLAITRHHHAVARVVVYRVAPGDDFVLAYLTKDGQLTDFDLVAN